MFKVGADKLLRDENGQLIAPFVNSFTAAELAFPGASVICCRLWDGTEEQGEEVAAEDAHQFRMTAASARRLAGLLHSIADDLDGVGQPHQ